MRVVRRGYHFALQEGRLGPERPLPPHYRMSSVGINEAELVIRLHSTRGRKAAWWKVGEEVPPEVLGQAPFEPVLRGLLSDFQWFPPGTLRTEEKPSVREVFQGGVEIINFVAEVRAPLPDPLQDVFKGILTGQPEAGRQGNLQICVFSPPPLIWDEEKIPPSLPYRRWFNHHLCGVLRFAWRVPRGTREGVALALFDNGGVILSPDHPNEHFFAEGWYVLKHPVPRDGMAD